MNRPDLPSILPEDSRPRRHEGAAALRRRVAGFLVLSGALLAPTATGAPPPTGWRMLLPSEVIPISPDTFDVARGNGIFVGVGGYGAVATSPDGLTWTPVLPDSFEYFGTVAFGGGKFVATGGAVLSTSADGIHWVHHPTDLGNTGQFFRIRYLGGLFVATGIEYIVGGSAGLIYTSTDGVQWSRRLFLPPPSGFAYVNPKGIAHGNGRFIVTVGSGRNDGTYTERVSTYSSPDGITWSPTATPVVESSAAAFSHDIAFGEGQFVLVASQHTWTSPDGAAWQLRHELDDAWFSRGIVAVGNRFVSVAERFNPADPNDRAGVALVSDDGISWQSSPLPTGLVRLFSDDATFFAVGTRTALFSPDGLIWAEHFEPAAFDPGSRGLQDITYGDDGFVAVGSEGTIMASPDGSWWEPRDPGSNEDLTDIAWGGGRYVASGANGSLLHSDDGQTWQPADLGGVTLALGPLAHGGGRFVLLSRTTNGGFFWTSDNGLDWELRFSAALDESFQSIAFGNGRFVAVGNNGAVAVSANGIAWQRGTVPEEFSGSTIRRIVFAGDRFVAISHSDWLTGALLSSVDGLTWTKMDRRPYWALGYGDGNLVAVHGEGATPYGDPLAVLQVSVDGSSFATAAPFSFNPASGSLRFAYGAGRFVGVGSNVDGTARLLISEIAAPQINLRRDPERLILTVRGAAGSTWNLQQSANLIDWQDLRSLILETDAVELDLTPPPGGEGFWRLSTP